MPTTTTTHQPAPRRLPIRPEVDAAIDAAFLAGGYEAAASAAHLVLGWTPTRAQLDVAIGRHAWLLGEERGDQGYQRRRAAAGDAMPRIGRPAERRGAPRRFDSIDRGFGIEIEFNQGSGEYNLRERIVEQCVADGLQAYVENYNHQTQAHWKMVTDATVSGGEFVSPILSGEAGHTEVRKALAAVRGCGGAPGKSQGMHVHHDVRDHDAADMARLVTNLRHTERAMLAYVPRYRYDGSGSYRASAQPPHAWERYASAVQDGYLLPAGTGRRSGGGWERYVSVNFNPVLAYGSVEFRALGNTLNATKVKTWIRVGQALIAYGKAGHEFDGPQSTESMLEALVAAGMLPRREAGRFLTVAADRRRTEGRQAAA